MNLLLNTGIDQPLTIRAISAVLIHLIWARHAKMQTQHIEFFSQLEILVMVRATRSILSDDLPLGLLNVKFEELQILAQYMLSPDCSPCQGP